jgi:phosphoenolpyruvate phosphomutase
MVKKTTELKRILHSKALDFFLEAHNGLSAKIVEEAGFPGVWASGLSISASLGVRDNNEASWTQILEVVEFMNDNIKIPLLLDGDTGYGNFNNVRRLVKKLEQRDVAGVCIEDKLFPKQNSFINDERQLLTSAEEFVGKIKAAKDTQKDSDFCVVARTEGFIVDRSLEETLERCVMYSEAGADAILVHSKLSTPDQIIAFEKKWDKHCPIVIVPTSYAQTPTSVFEKLDISLILWANHLLRASILQMQRTASQIYHDHSTQNIDNLIVPMKEVFRLQNVEELKTAEEIYLP